MSAAGSRPSFVEIGEQSLKNIAKPVRAYALSPEAIASARIEAPETIAAPASPLPAPDRREPPRLSLVVLPFANIGGDPEQEYFVDGVTESLTTDLSRISGAFVIGRSTAFTYKGKAVDLKQLGRELNVRYVLEGSIQRGGNRMRVNVQLIEAESGRHLWAERFDKPLADLFDMQDEIVARLANQLEAELITVEARRAEKAPAFDSMDLFFRGRAAYNRGVSPHLLTIARGFFEQALLLDSSNVEALVGLGTVDMNVSGGLSDDPAVIAAAAEASLAKALTLAPNHPFAHSTMGYICCFTNRAQRGVEEFERALSLDPNHARARAGIGLARMFIGRAEETEVHILEALRLSPRDARVSQWLLHAGLAKSYLGECEAAVAWLRKSIDANRNNPWPYFPLASCLMHLGRLDEARHELKNGFAVNPNFTIKRFRASVESDNPVYLAQRERAEERMRLAGVPKG